MSRNHRFLNNIQGKDITWIIRCPDGVDAVELSELRVLIDGETENLDREAGEGFLTPDDFKRIIREDAEDEKSLFLVAEVKGRIVGFARCAGNKLKRYRHKAEFGICILKEYWGKGIGKSLIGIAMNWADGAGVEKISLTVVETNAKAIQLYKRYGFVEEGLLMKDRIHSDGQYYNTLLMGRVRNSSL